MEVCVLTPADLEKFAHLYPPELPEELPADELLLGCVETDPLTAAGILMAHVESGEVFVDWLYVDEPYRRRGGGKAMLELLTREAAACEQVSGVNVVFSDRAENMEDLLRACSYIVAANGEDCGYRTTLGLFPRLPAPGEIEGKLVALSDVEAAELARFASVLDKGLLPNIAVPVPFDSADYLPESGVCLVDGRIRGVCLLTGDAESLSIAWIYSGAAVPSTLPALINSSISRLRERFSSETPLYFASVNGNVREIIERYIPVKERIEVYLGMYRFDL